MPTINIPENNIGSIRSLNAFFDISFINVNANIELTTKAEKLKTKLTQSTIS